VAALSAANATDNNDNEVVIPEGSKVSMTAYEMYNLKDVTIRIDGTLFATSDNWKEWPNRGGRIALLQFNGCDGLHITGKGTIDGRGFMWWMREWFQKNLDGGRPYLIKLSDCTNFEIDGLMVKNSPYYHIVTSDSEEGYFHDMEIYVDIWGQMDLHKLFNSTIKQSFLGMEERMFGMPNDLTFPLPTFPLNTDGVDIWGRNMVFRRMKITNFDDAIVPKPSNKGKKIHCTENILVEDIESVFTVGMTIGSVPPNDNTACIRNVTFRNIYMDKPLKGIYVKSNPGDHGDGIIADITYENFVMKFPVWWAVYIGPQQQKQPGGAGPGCMIYPINNDCPTNPRITMENITLRNITSTGGLLPAGILRCNSTNPCKNFTFEDVSIKGALWDLLNIGWITEYVEGT